MEVWPSLPLLSTYLGVYGDVCTDETAKQECALGELYNTEHVNKSNGTRILGNIFFFLTGQITKETEG